MPHLQPARKYGPYKHPGSPWEIVELLGFIPLTGLPARAGLAAKTGITAARAKRAGAVTLADDGAKVGMSLAEAESWAARRAAQLQSQLSAGSRGRVTMGAGVVRDGAGNQIRAVSTSEPRGYLRPGVTLEEGEVLVRGTGHAEADIVTWAADNGYEVLTVGAGRPICPVCAGFVFDSGGTAATPLK